MRALNGFATDTDRVEGGALVVISGAGAGQYRRITSWPQPSCHGTGQCVFTIDSKLTVSLDATSTVEVMPFRGNSEYISQDLLCWLQGQHGE